MLRFVGLLLMYIGFLWTAFSGLCSAVFVISLLNNGQTTDMTAVLLVGIPSTLVGLILYAIGRWLRPATHV